jgi:hypothetical protein
VIQKEGESLREFIQHCCNKRNIILEVDDKSIIMFFKKGLRDLPLICKLAMKNPRTSEEMLAITNKYTLVEERPSIIESRRRRRSQATQTNLAHPRATTRRGRWIVPSTPWNGHVVIRSTDPDRVNLKAF